LRWAIWWRTLRPPGETKGGDKRADLLLKNANLINVFSGEIYPAEVAIYGDTIVGIG
jgi:adenine deaminase